MTWQTRTRDKTTLAMLRPISVCSFAASACCGIFWAAHGSFDPIRVLEATVTFLAFFLFLLNGCNPPRLWLADVIFPWMALFVAHSFGMPFRCKLVFVAATIGLLSGTQRLRAAIMNDRSFTSPRPRLAIFAYVMVAIELLLTMLSLCILGMPLLLCGALIGILSLPVTLVYLSVNAAWSAIRTIRFEADDDGRAPAAWSAIRTIRFEADDDGRARDGKDEMVQIRIERV